MRAPPVRKSLLLLFLLACSKAPPRPTPVQQAEGLYLRATAEYLRGDFERALASFNEVKALDPRNPRLPAALGEAHLSMGRLSEAEKDFHEASERDPKRAAIWSRLGFIQSQLGERPEATRSLARALALNPMDFHALEEQGELEAKEGHEDPAVADLLKSAAVGPERERARLYLRGAELLRKKFRDDDALTLLQRAVEAGVASPELLAQTGELLVRQGKLEEASAAYRSAARAGPRDPAYWELVGEIESQRGRAANAREAYRESLRIQNRSAVHVALARLDLKQQDRAAALAELQLALGSASGDDPRDTRELADLLVVLGRKPDALRLYTLLASEPDSAKDAALQRVTATLARELGEAATVKAACARVEGRCP